MATTFVNGLMMEGPLSKWTNVVNGWQYRWFVLNANAGVLSYYTSKEKMMKGDRRGCVKLKDAQVGIDDEDDSTFTITVDHKTFHFQARDSEERQKWLEALQEARDLHTLNYRFFQSSLAAESDSSLAEFDRRLAEADVYLQLFIEQHNALEERLKSAASEEQKAHCDSLLLRLKGMIELVKQTIVCLQMAKQNCLNPLTQTLVFNLAKERGNTVELGQDALLDAIASGSCSTPVPSGVPVNTATLEHIGDTVLPRTSKSPPPGGSISRSKAASPRSSLASNVNREALVPMVSYSSSEDEEFFDTEEDILIAGTSRQTSISRGSSNGDQASYIEVSPSPSGVSLGPSKSSNTPRHHSSSLSEDTPATNLVHAVSLPAVNPSRLGKPDDYDELYEDEEEDLGSVQNHGFVISYLLSQLRIGMDLTRIALPTFILEKRSTLEMYADFLAHADLWSIIGDAPTPKDRVVACLRWYLSAFHAGRRSSVAKKPYNPILGEIFQCYWDVGDDCKESKNATPTDSGLFCDMTQVEDGETIPIPWAPDSGVVFIAEQVSHHPPISAFYAEHRKKGIALDGHLWTKSKFLGLSISVEMIGEAVISVLKHDEEYIITFPCGYGRNILTVPWVELGGKCTLTCAKTGYHATIDFRTKPFYGGKPHLIKAECYAPGEKKSFLSVDGEWNDKMWARWADGRNDLFVDTKSLPLIRKHVPPREQQFDYESRRLWENVTHYLRQRNMDEATKAKSHLEQKQRDEAKSRQERGLQWETRHFHEVGQHWVYDHPLVKRYEKRRHTLTSRGDQDGLCNSSSASANGTGLS